MKETVGLLLIFLASVYAPAHDHHDHHDPPPPGQDCHGPECVDRAIEKLSSYLDEALCHEIEKIHCEHHHIAHDEKICGSDGRTYRNHCLFVKARCRIIVDHRNYGNGMLTNPLSPKHVGACAVATAPPPTTTKRTTTSTSASAAISTSTGVNMQTSEAPASATSPHTTSSTPPAATTTLSLNSILGNVFCQHRTSINCITTLNMVCGSNGKFYPNICELLKEQCDDPTLGEAPDASVCTSTPGK